MEQILPIIIAGGVGSRLWPLSRQLYPKQCLSLLGDSSLLQTTLERLSDLPHQAAIVICNENHRFLIAEQLREKNIPNNGIILEPTSRNTAPAIALGALHALQLATLHPDKNTVKDPLLLVLPADHHIQDPKAFCLSIQKASPLAHEGNIVTFGILPTRAETGYGYIKAGAALKKGLGFNVDGFTEKPELSTAEAYLNSKRYYWNSGIFLVKASVYLEELKHHQADMLTACQQAMNNAQTDLDFIRVKPSAFEACPNNSIDYAIMEKTTKAVVMPIHNTWSDIGNWSTLWEIADKDTAGNSLHGDVINLNSHDTFVHAENKLVTIIGLNDLVVVETKDAVLISKKDHVQQVKDIVQQLEDNNRPEYRQHREVFRPWGKYDLLDHGAHFQVKRLSVKPGGKLSTQMHHHRAEHWVVVSGTAKITNGNQQLLLTENQSTYIPIGTIHSLENPGKIPLEMIEVQSGTYLEEDDIIRFSDEYGRK
ncbi:mannose-1-phosphate guanylyltransferase/mannose-6-phosphate isomerase [Shewanella surugensis]|uniref:mannose-1-phosphate guanylyltransferase n=1 Tax=Shewanella surugensis TaxID=212020 RepID=A0ABT0LBE9_9GAMM|nr:mannose-1-phosphate guanylyltransferase/mannose-6-phosphate isomerase [Shewanella surugensis]MCL1124690.1 mannose-1-phosphate guanylyltransferase/mannose-6-phosphate isomerase [Shewanella surugensis]